MNTLYNILDSRYWILYFTLLGGLFAFIMAPPQASVVLFSDDLSYWHTVEKQAENPFRLIEAPAGSHGANKSFRLTVPLISKFLHLKRKGIFVLQASTLFLMIGLGLSLVYRISSDKLFSLLFMGAMIPLYTILCSYQEATGHLDAFAYCLLFCAMYFRQPFAVFLFCTLASWCDERAFLATTLIFTWWYLQNPTSAVLRDHTVITKPNKQALAVLLSLFAYAVVRILLSLFSPLPLQLNNSDFFNIRYYIQLAPLLTFLTFGSLWVVLLLAVAQLAKGKKYLHIALLLLPLLLLGTVASIVWDFTRSLSFAFPILFVSLLVLKKHYDLERIRQITVVLFLMALVTPLIHFDSQLNHVPGLFQRGLETIVFLVFEPS